ncbi:unnamed protein product [Chironomus riparius]|uniref:Uncharacterized protein n=1 Tax=Chironomus riparius TaxID=315576 RepID=A0A9P0JAX2_9DIPT|nr:unnamed protein product [Chironomus riparius]
MCSINFLILSSILLINCGSPARKTTSYPYIRFTAMKCLSSSKSVSSFDCYVKAYSRTNTTMNVFVNLTRPIFAAKARYDLTYKYLTNSQRSIINSTLEICEFLNGTSANPVFKWIVGFMKNFDQMLHACPYTGNLIFKDLSVDIKQFVSAFPSGVYMTIMKFFDDVDENIMTLKFSQDLISKDRETF